MSKCVCVVAYSSEGFTVKLSSVVDPSEVAAAVFRSALRQGADPVRILEMAGAMEACSKVECPAPFVVEGNNG